MVMRKYCCNSCYHYGATHGQVHLNPLTVRVENVSLFGFCRDVVQHRVLTLVVFYAAKALLL